MGTDLTDNNAFDRYAARFGWAYDNGGYYRGEIWERFEGRVRNVVLMRGAQDQVCIVRFVEHIPSEIWSGTVRTTDDFDRMVASIDGKLEIDDTKTV
jgi:hypothetical protein